MVMRSRHGPPPYQVMKLNPPAGGPKVVRLDRPAEERSDIDATGEPRPTMVTLRLPRGFAVLAAGVLVSAILLAFWVGRETGWRRGIKDATVSNQQLLMAPGSGAPVMANPQALPTMLSGSPGPAAPTATKPPSAGPTSVKPGPTAATPAPAPGGSATAVTVPGSTHDMREKGLNYFIINYSQEYAQRLVEFLWQEGVEAQAIKPHNSRLFQVVALHGFRKEDLGSPDYRRYEDTLHRLGRLWKAQNPDATDLSAIYPSRYNGEEVDLVITRKR